MTDLLFSDLQNESLCPDDSFVIQSGKLYLDIGTFIGESVADLSSPKVAELAFKLARIGRYAQITKNAGGGVPLTSGNQVNSFDNPVFTSPVLNTATDTVTTTGSITTRVSFTFNPNDALTTNI